ncbi:unnamed protein product [Meloidogyne enterolobii]|uniref:Uncharacterized protein n=1 Tax=Meloidogyne enterolobii TaxID=390850 RepID=A0ACB0ZVD7_MELEN
MHIFVEFAFQILVDQLKGRSVNVETENENCLFFYFKLILDLFFLIVIEEENSPVLNDNPTQAKEFIPLLEQFVPILLEALKKKYDKITALSLRLIFYLFKWPLESLNSRLSELFDLLFVVLNDYASLGQSGNRPTIIELHLNLFKCFTHLLRSSPIISSLNTDRLQLLLNYVETDILDQQKQTTAFNLIKAIINMKIDDEKITNIIEYLSEKAITSLSTNIRSQCRQTILLYLINHPQGMRNYEYWMEFFLNQTEYEIVDGRLSALEEANDRYAMLVFLKLAARLQNEDNEQCLQFIVICLRKLFTSITESLFIDLHSAATDWLSARKPSIRVLAWRLFTQFVLSNSSHFTKHLLLKIVRKTFEEFCIEPNKFSSPDVSLDCKLSLCEFLNAVAENNPEELFNGIFEFDDQLDETKKFKKTLRKRKLKRIEKGEESENSNIPQHNFGNFIENLEFCLLSVKQRNEQQQTYESLKLSICAATFLNTWIGHLNIREKLINLLNKRTNTDENNKDGSKLYSFCICLVLLLENGRRRGRKDEELRNEDEEEKLQEEEGEEDEEKLIKNEEENFEEENLVEETCEENKIQLNRENTKEERREFWNDTLADLAIRLLTHFMLALDISKQFEILCRRLSRICWIEAIKETGKTKKRLCIFKMMGVLVLKCDSNSERFGHLVNNFLPLLYREMSDSLRISEEKNKNEDLQMLASEVGNFFRKQLGDREYSTQLAKCQREKDERKQKRREQAKAMLILNPSTAITIKQKRHLRKRTTKMRKMDEIKPYRAFKRRRREEALQRIRSEEV